MALYFYKALSKEGKKISGHLDASSIESTRAQLVAKGLYPFLIQIKTESQASSSLLSLIFERPVSTKDVIFFTKQLSVLLKSGVPLLQSLDLLSEQFSGKLRSIIISLRDGVKEGNSLAHGLQAYPKTFSKIYTQLIKAGEASGKLETILERLTEYLERSEETHKKVSGALNAPLIQLGIVFAVVTIIMIAVIPSLKSMLTSAGQSLPLPTQILLTISYILTNYYLALLLSLTMLAIGFKYWASQKSGKRTLDSIKLQLPIVSFFSRTSAIVQFCSTLGMLLESGVNLSNALDIVCNIIDNSILVDTLEQAKDKIIKQGKITQFLKETGIFPPMAIYLINTGEQSGKLDYMLLTVAKNYDTEFTESLTSKLDPIMTLLMGGIVGFIMWAIMAPMLSLYNMTGL